MKGLAFLALSLAFLAIGTIMIAPLAQFIYEEASDPKTFFVDSSHSPYNQTHVELILTARYNGSVSLSDLKLHVAIGEMTSEIYEKTMSKGQTFNLKMFVPTTEEQNIPNMHIKMTFSVAGIYPVEISVTRA